MLGFKVDGVVTVNGNSVVVHGSPTDTLRAHVIDALYLGANLGKIDKVVFFDGTSERDGTTPTTVINYSKPSPDQVQISCNITATANYTIQSVRLYSGSILYFEIGGVNQAVTSGTVVSVTVTITVQLVPSLTGDLSGATIGTQNITPWVADTLIGTSRLSDLRIANILINLPATEGSLQTSRPDPRTLRVFKSFLVTQSGTLTKVYLVNSAQNTILDISLSKSYAVNTTLNVTFLFTT